MGIDLLTLAAARKYTDTKTAESAGLKRIVVDTLPEKGNSNTVYCLEKTDAAGKTYYEEYMWWDNTEEFDAIGTTETTLEGYVKTEVLTKVLEDYATNDSVNEFIETINAEIEENKKLQAVTLSVLDDGHLHLTENYLKEKYELAYFDSVAAAADYINAGDYSSKPEKTNNSVAIVYRAEGSRIANIFLITTARETKTITIANETILNLNGNVIFTDNTSANGIAISADTTIIDTSKNKGGSINDFSVAAGTRNTINVTEGCSNFVMEGIEVDVESDNKTLNRFLQTLAAHNTIKDCSINVSTLTGAARVFQLSRNTLPDVESAVDNCTFSVHSENGLEVKTIVSYGHSTIKNCTINSVSKAMTTKGPMGNAAIVNYGYMTLENNTVKADAEDNDAASQAARAISNNGSLTVTSGKYVGTHSALGGTASTGSAHDVNVPAELRITGGTFVSCAHGGLYLYGASVNSYIENATIGCEVYDGVYDYSKMTNSYQGGFYVGGGANADYSNTNVYMNNVTFVSAADEPTFVIRGTSGERDNKVYISNTTVPVDRKIRVDDNNMLIVGQGTNISDSRVTKPANVTYTSLRYKYEDIYANRFDTLISDLYSSKANNTRGAILTITDATTMNNFPYEVGDYEIMQQYGDFNVYYYSSSGEEVIKTVGQAIGGNPTDVIPITFTEDSKEYTIAAIEPNAEVSLPLVTDRYLILAVETHVNNNNDIRAAAWDEQNKATVLAKLKTKADKLETSKQTRMGMTDTLTTVLIENVIYNIGTVSTPISFGFPTPTESNGQVIYINFECSAKITLTIDTSNTTTIDLVPAANKGYEIFASWNGTRWILGYDEYDIPVSTTSEETA